MQTNILGVKFKKEGRIYHFDAADLILHKNDQVLVNTDNGVAMGTVVTDVRRSEASELPGSLKNIIRKVTADDLRVREELELLEEEARKYCIGKIAEKGLSMKLITVECLFDRSKMIFYFTADARVDFRELVKDLVSRFKTRIELKQIGARQEARIVKGIAVCGRTVCCAGILQNLDRVTVKMAKEQSMSLNPEKISGLCGRLMCCLSFEHEGYADARKGAREAAKIEPVRESPGSGETPPPARIRTSSPREPKKKRKA
ncbi:MAG: regulatory iron-sulfur-containing complex subunit RicT [Smithellaceae bacterium]|jgi:cell fate regulator YaaT (PSP1 superfamily)|nr:regulatory iron-sulfur-containing complex subunit RicT [Smithellaceae bacterium]MDD3259124.1 regulatory iron-sulfur-containing complex subunit RicT [Smithellaceae bacterium]MDD3849175.1 regulatory iron-sulfur-containing complex subunit RicT [Smithellaceae bacterium]HOG12924.1 regulatory iron-sulfur-containing complex subunit RicT [Smithellaceae bacterium]HOQ72553.1 regulatory iron-sulfur-containing complex subunit RicT [Smithellaceae bacterium]